MMMNEQVNTTENPQQISIDLHSHSLFSDGTLTPTELVTRAHEQGVNVLALTDHDEVKGLEEASLTATKLGVTLINGVEISVSWDRNQTIHIIGLNIDPENAELRAGLSLIRDERIKRAKKIAEKLEKSGIENVWQSITETYGFEAVTRTHFARFLIENGHAKDMQQCFKKYLGSKGRAYVNGSWLPLADAVGWIISAGGQAVIAHPTRYRMTKAKLERLVTDFKNSGGVGLEVVSQRFSEKEKAEMASLARRFDLLASVGSDFHNPGNPYVELGRNLTLPLDCKPIWDDWNLPLADRCE